MVVTRTNSAKVRNRRKHNNLRRQWVDRLTIGPALRAASDKMAAFGDGLGADLDVLEDVGLGGTGRAEALRRLLEQSDAEQIHLRAVATDIEECGRTVLQEECAEGHARHKPFLCNKAVCPECAARRARKLSRIYAARVASRLHRAPRGVKARLVTLPYRPRDTEDHRAAFNRCRPAVCTTLRLCFGIPATAAEWRLYFELEPITAAELDKVPVETAAGRRRAYKTRHRQAMTHRRRALKLQPARRAFGAVVSIEFGETGGLAHGHALVVGRYVDQRLISRAWQLATGGTSYIAHIRAVDNVRAGATEALKYLAKFGAHSPDQLVDIYRSTLMFRKGRYGELTVRQRRRAEPLGTLRGKLEEEHPPAPPCEICGKPMRVVGSIPWSMWIMGVRNVPEERRFTRRPRGPD